MEQERRVILEYEDTTDIAAVEQEPQRLVSIHVETPEGSLLRLRVPEDTPDESVAQVVQARLTDIAVLGPAFAAYLQLADTDATRTDLAEQHRGYLIGDFADMDEILRELTEAPAWQRDLQEFARQRGIEDLVRLDWNALRRIARSTWDIVEAGGRLYVFDK